MHSIDKKRELCQVALLITFDDTLPATIQSMPAKGRDYVGVSRSPAGHYGKHCYEWRMMAREFPESPLIGVGAVIVHEGRVLLVKRGREPLKGCWSLPGGLVEVGESLREAVVREVAEETGLVVEAMDLIELLDRIHREEGRVRYHYVIADFLCRVAGGRLGAASDAEAVRWIERSEWLDSSRIGLDAVAVRVIEAGWQRVQELRLQEGC